MASIALFLLGLFVWICGWMMNLAVWYCIPGLLFDLVVGRRFRIVSRKRIITPVVYYYLKIGWVIASVMLFYTAKVMMLNA